jgi:hypothetical protein
MMKRFNFLEVLLLFFEVDVLFIKNKNGDFNRTQNYIWLYLIIYVQSLYTFHSVDINTCTMRMVKCLQHYADG